MSENYNATGEIKEIGILDMMNGAIGERTAYELSRIMKNCRDLNTEAKKARTLTIKLSIVPTENRDSVAVRAGGEQQAGSGQADRRRTAARRYGRRPHRYGVHAAGARPAVVRPAVDTEPKVVKLA